MNELKRIFVTGANKGVGFAIVRAILEKQDTFVFLGARSKERGERAIKELISDNKEWAERVELLEIDVSDEESIKGAAKRMKERFDEEQPLYGLVNNAGIGLGSADMRGVLEVNTWGPKRVFAAFEPLIKRPGGRVVNIASASGPNFVARCSQERQRQFTNPEITWEEIEEVMEEALEIDREGGDFAAAGLGDGAPYGLSKALVNALTIWQARENPELKINACTPGYIETDLTRPFAERQGVKPSQMGMKPPEEGTKSTLFLLFGEPGGSGWYFGSDAVRSPLDRYRAPGDPAYQGD